MIKAESKTGLTNERTGVHCGRTSTCGGKMLASEKKRGEGGLKVQKVENSMAFGSRCLE